MTLLRQRMIEVMQLRNFSIHTQKAYALHVALFARHFDQSPDLLGPENIRTYQLYLRAQKQWGPASIIQATAALRPAGPPRFALLSPSIPGTVETGV